MWGLLFLTRGDTPLYCPLGRRLKSITTIRVKFVAHFEMRVNYVGEFKKFYAGQNYPTSILC